MPKIEPGVYEPSDDVRGFDDADDMEDEGSRLPLLIVIALLVLAAFGGVVWLAYNQGVQRGRTDAPRPLVADTTTHLKVYDQPVPADADNSDTDSVPAPPTVKTPPTAMTAAPAEEPKHTAPPPTVVASAPPPEVATKPPEQLVAPKPKAKPVEAAPKPIASVAPPTDMAAPATAESSGAYVLQIGAYKSEDEANAAWKTYEAKHPSVGGSEFDVKKVDLGDKGVWYRLRIGAFASKDAANALCDKLKADGAACMLAKK
ncbi:MAG TPA: SPOR domain-containing protein [Rhizomicrobium sp.]|nr:SPOR domain-containing protein [Rhizomicrobium sp.]